MLFGEHPILVDFDPHQFRNLMELVLPTRSARGRLYVIHENGQVLKGFHSLQGHVRDYEWPQIDEPEGVARQLLEQFQVDTIALLERTALGRYFADLQAGHRLGEDMFEFAARGMDLWREKYAEEIVVVPKPLAQFSKARLKAVTRALYETVPDGQHVVVVVFDDRKIWTSLILGIRNQTIDLVTSLAALGILGGETTEWQEMPGIVIPQVERHFGPVAIGLFMQLSAFKEMIASENWIAWLYKFGSTQHVTVEPCPKQLSATA